MLENLPKLFDERVEFFFENYSRGADGGQTSTHNNARMEGLNGLFEAARARARGYRNTATFITMIHLIAAPLGKLFDSIRNVEEPLF